MGFSSKLIGFPIFVLGLSILFQTGAIASAASSNPVTFCGANGCTNANLIQQTCSVGTPACFPSGLPANSVINCQGTSGACWLTTTCTQNFADPIFCTQAGLFLAAGQTATTDSTGTVNANSQTFLFGSIGTSGFTVLVTVAVGIAAIAGLNVFGSGESSESVHILFVGGILMGIWLIFSAAEGFLSNSSGSFFVQLNVAFSGIGSAFYVILTLIYTFGVIGAISRGASN